LGFVLDFIKYTPSTVLNYRLPSYILLDYMLLNYVIFNYMLFNYNPPGKKLDNASHHHNAS
jgi:hypothetical protein